MRRCTARTKSGRGCHKSCRPGSDFCHIHADEFSPGELIATTLGAALGSIISPGLGTVAGGLALRKLRQNLADGEKRKTKVFLSFDFDQDRGLRDLMLGQAKHPDVPFEVVNHSLMEAAPEPEWEAKANTAIKHSDLVVVLLGQKTYRALGVLKEVQMARAAGIPLAQIIGYRNRPYVAVPNAGRVYAWTRTNLTKLFS